MEAGIQRTSMTCKLIEVIQAYVTRGRGTPENPYRTVTQFWSKEGELLAENDPHPVTEPKESHAHAG